MDACAVIRGQVSGAGRARWRACALALLLISALLTAPLAAKTLNIASAFDPQSMDPHALALVYHSRVSTQIYESLVNRGRTFELEPSLALSWQPIDAKTWRFRLRPNVRFHDGTPVHRRRRRVLDRARAGQDVAALRFSCARVTGARKVDELTVDIVLAAPDAVLPDKFLVWA